MPNAAEFLSGFNFVKGTRIDGYTLVDATSTHESIKRYNEYRYNIILTFSKDLKVPGILFTNLGNGSYQYLFDEIMKLIAQEHIIYGVRNPYRCMIDFPKYGDILEDDNGTITFNLVGHSHRVYNKYT